MQRRIDDIVLDILIAIDYPSDKQKFVKEFLELNHSETLLNLLERLPEETQKKIKVIKEQKDAIEEIKRHIQQEEYMDELRKVSANALERFLETIAPSLTPVQKEKIGKALNEQSAS